MEEMNYLPQKKRSIYTLFIKRLIDIIISGIAIIILSPLLLCVSILELIIHGRPIMFVQQRPGLNEEMFNIYKFRTMTNQKDENGELLPGNKRVTKFGKFLRKTSIDELPELFCIFIGKMSIIGPRPLLPEYLNYYTDRHRMRHLVRPGLACIPILPIKTWSWNDQFENDIFYVENCSFIIDVKMFIGTIKEAIYGSEYRVEDTRKEFNGDNLYEDAKNGE